MARILEMVRNVVDIGWWRRLSLIQRIDVVLKETRINEEIRLAIYEDLSEKITIVENSLSLLERFVPRLLGGARYNLARALDHNLDLVERKQNIEMALCQLNHLAFRVIIEETEVDDGLLDGADLARVFFPILATLLSEDEDQR